MKVYILFRDVPFEFGEIHGVFSTKEKAEVYKEQVRCQELDYYNNHGMTPQKREKFDEEYIIQEWEVE